MAPDSGSPYLGNDLDIVVVHYQTPDILLDCLARIAKAAPHASLFLVDTAPDEAVLTRAAAQTDRVRVVRSVNHSFSHAVNQGARPGGSRLLALMNADVLVEPRTFADLVAAVDSGPLVGAAGPLALTRSGAPQDLGLPYRLNYLRLARAPQGRVRAPWLSGCLQLLRRDLFEALGGYDERLRFTNEDLDFCIRVRRAGFTCLLTDTPVLHLGGSATPAHPAFHIEGRRGGYQITRRYLPAFAAPLHRAYLRLESAVGELFARGAAARASHAGVRRLLAEGDWEQSPFGATLDDR